MRFTVDPELEKYCATENQWTILKAWGKHGSQKKAAESLGIDKRRFGQVLAAVTKRAAQHGYILNCVVNSDCGNRFSVTHVTPEMAE